MSASQTRSKLDHALDHARSGLPVFPVIPNGKRPAIANWRSLATTDESTIRRWWEANPDRNIGIATDSLVVIDVDPRKGGKASMFLLMLTEDFPKTRRSATWSGGDHLLYRCPPHTHVKGGADKLGSGIDIRAWGGLIVAPGSTIDGKPYEWINNQPIVEAPQWLIERLKAPKPKTTSAGQRIVEEDALAVQRAERWMLDHAPEAEEGNRDDTAFKVAARVYDEGVTPETCREIMQDWNFNKCHPALDEPEIERLVQSAAKNRTRAIGSGHPLAPGFEAVEIAPKPSNANGLTTKQTPEEIGTKPRLYYVPFAEAATNALKVAAAPLVKGLLDRGAMSVWYGKSNSGKTFVVGDLSWHIPMGRTYNGMRVRHGAVVYIAPEGGRGFYKRMAALRCARPETPDNLPFFAVPCPVNLLRGDADLRPLIAMIGDIEAGCGQKVELVVVDTLSRALAGGDENSSVDMGALVRNFDLLRVGTDAHLAIVHHSGKDQARGARGHSLLQAATDTEIEIADHTVTVTKQRDLDGDKSWRFKLVPVRLGEDADGDPVTSCVVETVMNGAAEPGPLAGDEAVFADALLSGIMVRDGLKDVGECVGKEFKTREAIAIIRQNTAQFAHVQTLSEGAFRNMVTSRLHILHKNAHLEKPKHGQWVVKFAQDA